MWWIIHEFDQIDVPICLTEDQDRRIYVYKCVCVCVKETLSGAEAGGPTEHAEPCPKGDTWVVLLGTPA